jgi:hypothetical protein
MLSKFKELAGFEYYTKSFSGLFSKNIPDGWFINSDNQLFIIENKIHSTQESESFVQLNKYANCVFDRCKLFEIFLVFGSLDALTNELKYKIYEFNIGTQLQTKYKLVWQNFSLEKPFLNHWLIYDTKTIYFANTMKKILYKFNTKLAPYSSEKLIKYIFFDSPYKIVCNDFIDLLMDLEKNNLQSLNEYHISVIKKRQIKEDKFRFELKINPYHFPYAMQVMHNFKVKDDTKYYVCGSKCKTTYTKEIIDIFQEIIDVCIKCEFLVSEYISGAVVETILFNVPILRSEDKFIEKLYMLLNFE